MCEKYNGWTNWETWNAALWISEVDGMGDEIFAQALKEIEDNTDDDTVDIPTAKYTLSRWLEEFSTETFFGHIDIDELHGPAADAIFVGYIPSVDWYSIAEHYITDAQEEV